MPGIKRPIRSKLPVPWATAVVAALLIGVAGGHYLIPTHAATSAWAYGCNQTRLPTLSYGSTGGCVKLAQYWLNYHGAHLSVDGIFGQNTYNAVINFQRSRHIGVDGIIGPITWSRLIVT